jgi:hypothetical protein
MPTEPRNFDDWKRHAVYLRDGYRCSYSGYVDTTCTGKRLSLDHITPIHKGGALQNKRGEPADNLTTAHGPTNFAKGDKTQEEWSGYAKDIAPPKSGLRFDWKQIETGAKAPLDMKRGEQLSKLAAQARDARRLDANGKRTIETPKSRAFAAQAQEIVKSYQAEQAAKSSTQPAAPAQKPEGPGEHHGEGGKFESGARVAARTEARITPDRMARMVAHYQRLQGLAASGDYRGWRFAVEVVPGLQRDGEDAWAVVAMATDAAGKLVRGPDGAFMATVWVRDIDATPIPGFDGDPFYEIRVTISHEMGHCSIAEFLDAGGGEAAEERLVETVAQAIVASEGTTDAAVMARTAATFPARLRARISARAPLARGGKMDPKSITEALEALIAGDSEKCAEILKGIIAKAAGGAAPAADMPPPSDAAPPIEGAPARTPGDVGPVAPAGAPAEQEARVAARLATVDKLVRDVERMHAAQLPGAKEGLIVRARARLALTPASEARIMKATTFEEAEGILAILEEAGVGTTQRARSGVEHRASPDTSEGAAKGEPDDKLVAEGFTADWIARYRSVLKEGGEAAGAATLENGRKTLARSKARKAREAAAQNGASR